jgi:hypothetical protein
VQYQLTAVRFAIDNQHISPPAHPKNDSRAPKALRLSQNSEIPPKEVVDRSVQPTKSTIVKNAEHNQGLKL